jgi:Spy/CpxP family protein refolding chaperone
MTTRSLSLALAGALVGVLTIAPAFAQETNNSDDSILEFAAQAFGIDDPGSLMQNDSLASLPAPDSILFALQAASPNDMDSAFTQVADADGPGMHGGPHPGRPGGWGGPGGPGGPGGHMHGPFGMLMQGPNALTDDQFEKMYAIRNQTMDAVAPKKLALHQATRDLFDALSRPDQDTARIKSLQSQVTSLKSDISSAELSKMVQMSQVLTPEQRKAVRTGMIRGCVGGMMGHHHHGMMDHH